LADKTKHAFLQKKNGCPHKFSFCDLPFLFTALLLMMCCYCCTVFNEGKLMIVVDSALLVDEREGV